MAKARDKQKEERYDRSYYTGEGAMTPEYIRLNFPIIGIEKFGTTVKIIRGSRLPPPSPRLKSDKRGKITHLSQKSIDRLAFLARENKSMFASLLTLTYGDIAPRDGRELKVQLNRVLTYLRRKHRAQYVWFLEFTKKDRPHIHILMDFAPSIVDRFYLADYWANGVCIHWPVELQVPFLLQVDTRNKMQKVHFHKKAWEILREKEGAARYVTKYATKLYQKEVPPNFSDVGRFWGASREVSLGDPEFKVDVTEDDLREWLKKTMDRDLDHFDVLPKYVYLFNEE